MKSIFISYVREDSDTCERLAGWLRQAGYDVWYDENLKGGDVWWRRICEEIHDRDMTLLLMQPKVFSSVYCPVEVRYAQALGKAVLPLKLADFDDADLPSWLDHVSYEQWHGLPTVGSFAQVLGAVNSAESAEMPEGVQSPSVPKRKVDQLAQRASDIREVMTGDLGAGQQHELVDDIVVLAGDGGTALATELLGELKRLPELRYPVAQRIDTISLPDSPVQINSAPVVLVRADDANGPILPEMINIPTGSFLMGSPKDETEREGNEGPQHNVQLSAFKMARDVVTFDEYERYCQATDCKPPSDQKWGRGTRPVINVSWDDAMDYIHWLNDKTGETFCLPTEAQWEYASRAGSTAPYWTGQRIGHHQANFGSRRGKTVAVDQLEATNPWGLRHMHGNVWEWCADGYVDYRMAEQVDPVGPEASQRVLRGGAWDNAGRSLRSAFRKRRQPGDRHISIGFRLAQVL